MLNNLDGMEFFDAGAKNFLTIDGIIGVIQPDTAPNRRIKENARNDGRFLDFTKDKETRALILKLTDNGLYVIASTRYAQILINDIQRCRRNKESSIPITPNTSEVAPAADSSN